MLQQERTPDESDFTDALASGAGSMATFFIPGVGIAKGAGGVARIGPRMAAWAGAGASGVMEAAVEAGGVYEDTLLKTKDINEAEKAASKTFWWNVPLVVITNKLGFLGETGGAIKRGIVSSQVEGFQELAQEYISTSSQGEKATPKDLLTAYGVGALTGGAAGAISAATDTKGVAPAPAELTKAEQPAAPAAEPVLPSTEPAPLSTIGEQIKAKQPEVYDQLKKEAQVTATDRRQDFETRKSVAEMTTEEMQTALLTDELTGLKNKRAYAEAEKKPFQVKSDVDGLKWINDNYGEDAGHALLKVKADALKAEGVEAYRTGGGEYYSQFDSAEQADEVMQTVAKRLESSIIESSNPDGTITRYTGGRFSYGIGRDAKGADAALRTSKEVRERAGERAGRGNKPIGLVEVAKGQRMGETGGEAESNIPAGEVEPLLKPTEIPIKKAPLELNKSQRQTLEAVKQEIEQGEPARRVVAKSEFDTTNLVEGGTYPDYFKGKGYTKKDTLIAINKALDGQPLTENQKIIVNDLNTGYRRQATDTLLTEHEKKIAPQKTAWDLNEGDKFKIEGESFKVTDVNQEGLLLEVTLKDGKTYTLKGDEIINYDKGSFKKTAEPGGAATADTGEYTKTARQAIELPEIVELANELMEGRYPYIKKKLRLMQGMARGVFSPKKGNIGLRADIFKDVHEASRVLAHEICLLVDWLPDRYMQRGNLLGRIATLKRYMSDAYQGLMSNFTIRDELKKLTQIIKPFDDKANRKFTKYRYSSKELYADAFSTLINDPALLKNTAPNFYKGLFEYFDRKPQVKALYDEIQSRIKNKGAVLAQREVKSREMSQKGEKLREAKEQKKPAALSKLGDAFKKALIDENTEIISKIKKAKKEGKISDESSRYKLEEKAYIPSEILAYRNRIDGEVIAPLEKHGITIEDIGEYVKYRRIATERADIANPLGHTKETAEQQLAMLN